MTTDKVSFATARWLLFFAVAVALPLLPIPYGCTKEESESCTPVVERQVGITMVSPDVDLDLNVATKVSPVNYDTQGESKEQADGKWYRMHWEVGDRIYCYSPNGIFGDHVLTSDDLLPGSSCEGEKAKARIVYRQGDDWIVCYSKGSAVGEHIGARQERRLVLSGGVPREQTGTFADSYIGLVRTNPDNDEYAFENMQTYIRFEVTQSGERRDGRLLGQPVSKITIESLSSTEKMAGNLEIVDDNGWRTSLQDSGLDDDKTITVRTPVDTFAPSSTNLVNYFVAVPARRYAKGMRFSLFTKTEENGKTVESVKGYVELPATTIRNGQILNCHDLLKYCAIYVNGINFSYGPKDSVETTGITMAAGHSGVLKPVITPDTATDKSMQWTVDDATVCTVTRDGTVTALESGVGRSCIVSCTAKDRGIIKQAVTVNVTPVAGIAPGSYGYSQLDW